MTKHSNMEHEFTEVTCCIPSRNQKTIMSLLEELDVQIYDQWFTGSKVLHGTDDVITKYSSQIPPMSYFAILDLLWSTYKVCCKTTLLLVCL